MILIKALCVIDVQNDFCPGGSLEVPQGDEIIPIVNSISPLFTEVIATKDWHPEGHISFASSYTDKKPMDTVERDGETEVLWPDHCIKGSRGAEFHPDLDIVPITLILHKGFRKDLDSYSAIFENDHQTPTGLEFYLKGLHIDEIFICGLAADVCVYFSVMDSLKQGFKVNLIEDATRGVDQPAGSLEKAMDTMRKEGARFIRSDQVEDYL